MKKLLSCFTLAPTLLVAASYQFNYQPAGNPWPTAGVEGGIPNRNIIYQTITSTGNDQSSAINTAIANCPAGQVVYLPSASYIVNSQITFGIHSGVVLRGAGINNTKLISSSPGEAGIKMGIGDWPPWGITSANNIVTAGATAGSNTLTIGSTTTFSVGDIMSIRYSDQHNNAAIKAGAVPVLKTDTSAADFRGQTVRLVSKTSTTLTFTPALYNTPDSGLTITVLNVSNRIVGSGIEDLTIDLNNGSSAYGIWIEQGDSCWVRNVKAVGVKNFNFYMLNSIECEFRRLWSDVTRGYGVNNNSGIIVEGTGHSLFIDNILYKNFPGIEVNYRTSGCVFAYNYCVESTSGTVVGCSIDSNHGPHNSFNLYEGNCVPMFQADGFFGSSSEDTVFRNWFTAVSPGAASPRDPVNLKRLARRYQIIGNLLGSVGTNITPYSEIGQPNIGSASYIGTAQPTAGAFWSDWPNPTTPGGYQELDLDVRTSSTFKGNYDAYLGSIIAGESLSTDTIPDSLFLSVKPAWFGNLAWPAYDPTSPNLRAAAIPAGYRYINGVEVPPGTATAPSNAKTVIVAP